MKRLILLFCLASLLYPFSIQAVNQTLYSSLKDGASIRGLTMGGAFTGVGEGPGGQTFNPAGAGLPGFGIAIEELDQDRRFFDDFSAEHIYLAPFTYSKWRKQSANGDRTTVQSYGFAQRHSSGIDWGVTYRSVAFHTNNSSERGWSADIGALFHMTPNLNWGVVIQDALENDLNVSTTYRTGLAWKPFMHNWLITGDVSLDKDSNDTGIIETHIGTEYALTPGFIIRGGMQNDILSLGGSFQLPFIELTYAALLATDGDDSTTMVGFRAGSGIIETEREQRHYALFKPQSYAKFRLSGNLIEGKSEISLLGGQKIGSNDLLTLIHMARQDEYCKGFIIQVGSLSSSIASVGIIQELRNELIDAKRDGKKIYIYLENWATLPEYYLATAADKIIMPSLGSISHLGLELEITKVKTLMNNFGFDAQVISSGIYKASLHPSAPSPNLDQKLVLEELLNKLYNQVLFDVKSARGLEWESINEIFNGQIISSTEALEKGLIDALGYWDEVEKIAGIDPKDLNTTQAYPLDEFVKTSGSLSIFAPANQIAVIEIDGPIHSGRNGNNIIFGGKSTGADDIDDIANAIIENNRIKGVILRVNTPGGSLIGSDRIYHALLKIKEEGKPIYTSMGNIATSGGYYVSLPSDRIFANRGTLTGSIGVISIFDNMQKFNEILGIEKDVIKTGKYVDMMSNTRPLTEEEVDMIQNFQKAQYEAFTSKVERHRNLTKDKVYVVSQGQVFSGEQAQENGLIDQIGGFYDVVREMDKKLKIDGEPELVFFRRQKPNIIGILRRWLFF